MQITDSARKHGIDDDDISHAVRFELRTIAEDDRLLIIGPDRTGRLLEIVILDRDDEPLVTHAMPLRAKFYDYLR